MYKITISAFICKVSILHHLSFTKE